MTSSREYAARRKAEHDAAVAAGKDPEDFQRNDKSEILCGVTCNSPALEKLLAIGQVHDCEEGGFGILGISFNVPESKVESLMATLREFGYDTENHGRINASGIPEELD
jgi:hypothetical protein